jgi:ribonuclease HIII
MARAPAAIACVPAAPSSALDSRSRTRATFSLFADERYLYQRLRKRTRRGHMRLEDRTKAESDVAVAAASILARGRSAGWLDEASNAPGVTLPKGAGPQVITTGVR